MDASKGLTKSSFADKIHGMISSKFVGVDLDKLEYPDWRIRWILLLHNIETILGNEREGERFPFDKFKREKWDVEHIHAVGDKLETEQEQREFIESAHPFVERGSKLIEEIEASLQKVGEGSLKELVKKVLEYFSAGERYESEDELSNLALLNSTINQSFKDAVFPAKRKVILEQDRLGSFIPVCTRNVFSKYYSPDIRQFSFWGNQERKDYLSNIEEVLKHYIN